MAGKLFLLSGGPIDQIEVDRVRYHRNGISGVGFFVIDFTHKDQRLIGTMFDDESDCYVAVIDPTDIHAGFRGDNFAAALRKAAREASESGQAHAWA